MRFARSFKLAEFWIALGPLAALLASGCEQAANQHVAAQLPEPAPEHTCTAEQHAPDVLRKRPGYTEVAVTVTNARGAYIRNLGKDDFKVTLGGKDLPIEFFQAEADEPATVGIVVDTSGSMEPKIPQARAAIRQFMNDLNKSDDVFLFAFSARPYLLQPTTTEHDKVLARLALLHAYGQTALFDSILASVKYADNGCYQRKAILVITDGMDNTSVSRISDVEAEVRAQNVQIYSVGIGEPSREGVRPPIAVGPIVPGGGDIDRVDATTLETLADETGSRAVIIRQVGDGDALKSACQSVAEDLRRQYAIGFVPRVPSPGAPPNALSIQVPKYPDAKVLAPKNALASALPEPATPSPR